jgi:uncharacterized protein (DUF58 family)
MRRLEVTFAGYWYTALTIGLGVAALLSANNVLYLIESLLLSGMIFSGVLSERTVSALEVKFQRKHVSAGSAPKDVIRVRNKKRFPVFCVEVGEWVDGEFVIHGFIPKISANETVNLQSKIIFPDRGLYRWEGLATGTSYPFGLAKKIRIQYTPGTRTIWPKKLGKAKTNLSANEQQGTRLGSEFAEGEIRPYAYEDDCRLIVWPQSIKGLGPMVRPKSGAKVEPRVTLFLYELFQMEKGAREIKISSASTPFYSLNESGNEQNGILTLVSEDGSKTSFHGKVAALNQLALIGLKPEERKAA